jgi:hypothetical protein
LVLRADEHISYRFTEIVGRQERNPWQPVTHLPVIQFLPSFDHDHWESSNPDVSNVT